MDRIPKNKDEEINKAIVEWLVNKNYINSQQAFLADTNLKLEDATKGNALEKRWGTILTLQKKISDLENQNKQLKEDLERAGTGDTTEILKRENESMGIPKAPAKATIKGHRGTITCIIFHPYYNVLVSGSEDASIIIWECEEFNKERSVKAHTNTVNGMAFDNLGKLLASCSADLTIKLWNFDTLSCIKILNGHEHTVSFVEFSPDGTYLYSASRDKTIKVWEIATGNNKKTLIGHYEWVRCLSINNQGNLLASSSDDETIIVWNIESSQQVYNLTGHENKIEHIVFVKNQIALQNIYNSDYLDQFNKSLNGNIEEHVPDSNLSNLKELNKQILEKSKIKDQKINKEYIISASRDKTIKIWDVFGSSCIYTILAHDNWVRSLLIHPNGKYLISSSDDKSIRVFELKTGRVTKKLIDAHERFVVSLAINHKYPLMASGSNDQTIRIWDCK